MFVCKRTGVSFLSQTSNFFCKFATCEDVSKPNISETNDFIGEKIFEMPIITVDEDLHLLFSDHLQKTY